MKSVWLQAVVLTGAIAVLATVANEFDLRWLMSTASGAVATVAVVVGVRRHRPSETSPWWFVVAALTSFTVAVVIWRFVSIAGSDASRIVGYSVLGVGLVVWLTAIRRRDTVDPLIDGVLVALSVMLVIWVVVLSPMLLCSGEGSGLSMAQSLFPAIDAALVTLVVYLLSSSRAVNRSLRWMLWAFALFFVGDMMNVLILSGLLDDVAIVRTTGYSAGILAVGIAALDRSMVDISPLPLTAPARTPERGALVVIVLVTCSVFPVVLTAANRTDLVVRAVLLSLVVIGTFTRGERALRAVKSAKDRAHYDATHDGLTGLLNRSVLPTVVDHVSVSSAPVAVLFVDLDNFKFVNDSYGHAVGDELICEVAARIDAAVREAAGDVGYADVLRYAGDEFVVVTDLRHDSVTDLAHRLVETIRRPFTAGATTFTVTATVGVSTSSSVGDVGQLTALIADADTAMYHAKSRGPNRVAFFDEPLRAQSTASTAIAKALRGACARGEFEVHYQPIVATRSRRTLIYEALVRWRRDGAVIAPDQFVPIAESIDLIGEIGEFVLDRAVGDLAALRADGRSDLTMSVNVSALQLRDESFPDVVREILARHGVEGSSLALEITETALIGDVDSAESVVRRLKEQDVLIVLDDFGVGFSSLGRLQQLPIDVVKIDKSFVAGLGQGESALTLVSAIASMLDTLGIVSVAEGVETEEQMTVVEQVGCRFAQGFLLGRPRPLDYWLTASASLR